MTFSLRTLLVSTSMLVIASVAAQAAQDVPSAAEPSRATSQIAPMQAPGISSNAPGVATGGVVQAPAGAEKVKLTLKSVSIDGMTAYDTADVSSLYAGMIGTEISLADVYGLAEKLTVKYRNEGYVLTQVVVPPQTIDGGNVRLRVVEGFIDKVSIRGGSEKDIEFLSRFADKLRAAKPLNASALERYVLLMNDISGVTARAVLSPSPSTPGASDVTLVVEQKPYNAFLQVDNRGSRYLGPLQLNSGARFNNVFGLHEALNVQLVTAPENLHDRELDYINLGWTQHLGGEGTRLNLSASVTSTHPGYTLDVFDVEGVAHNYSLELMHPFIRARNKNLFGTLKFNYLNSERNDNLNLGKTEDRLRVLRAGGTWQFTDQFVGVNTLTGELSKGLDTMGATDFTATNKTRARGVPDFFKGTLEISRLQRIGDKFELFASVAGQKSANTLLASEEFGVGGINYGSAYDNSEITGEDGLAARMELRANNPFAMPYDLVQLYGFYDVGKVWDEDNAVAKDRIRSLASTGVGARMTFNPVISATFEVAQPLTREVETYGNKDPRVFGSLTAKF